MTRVHAMAVLLAVVLTAIGLTTAVGTNEAAAQPFSPLRPVAKVDVARYLGVWHQLAAVPAPFNLVCARDTTAEYRLRDAADVAVRNSCTTWSGQPNTITGNARLVDARTNAQFHVSFPSVPSASAVDGPPNYINAALLPDYSLAVVGDPPRLSGFVLARDARVGAARWHQIRRTVESLGYNSCGFLTSPTTGGYQQLRPLCTL